MSKPKANPTKKADRVYESDVLALQALRLIAAPNPQDDISDEELENFIQKQQFSSNLIQQIVKTVKSL